MSDPIAWLNFPPEWLACRTWERCEIVSALVHEPTGTRCFIAGGLLHDGTNLIGLVSEHGHQHVLRMGEETGWALEERLDPKAPKWMRPIWRRVVNAMVAGKHEAEAELGRRL